MRLPQLIAQPLSVRAIPFLTIVAAFLFVSLLPTSAMAAQQLSSSPANLHFGNVDVGNTETLLASVTNTGETSVTVTAIASSNPVFVTSSMSLPVTLSAGESLDLNIAFQPSKTGWTSGTITFSCSGSNPPLTLDVAGTGVNSEATTANPATLSFGSVTTGSQSTLPVVITNARSWSLTLTSFRTNGNGFSLSGSAFPITLGSGESVTLNVTFAPQSAGEAGGSLFLYGPGLNIPLTGTGTTATTYSVNLYWNAEENVTGYNIYRSTSATGTFSKINSTLDANTAYTDSAVVAGQTYYYEATAVNSSGQESSRSTPAVQVVIP